MSLIEKNIVIDPSYHGERIDKALAHIWPEYSRSKIQSWLLDESLLVSGQPVSVNYKLKKNDEILLKAKEEPIGEWIGEPLEFKVFYEDEHLIIVNKPAGLVVHPAVGNWSGTLVNGLIHRFPELKNLPRAGIVHRLDKETTGLMVVARTLESHTWLVDQLQQRLIHRQYKAIGIGDPVLSPQTIDLAIGRHPKNRLKMAVVPNGKPARTHFKQVASYGPFQLFDVKLETGRTHQIRVHLSHVNLPLLGDQVYGGSSQWLKETVLKGYADTRVEPIVSFGRQALHASRLKLMHPQSRQWMQFESQLPEDFKQVLEDLKAVFLPE